MTSAPCDGVIKEEWKTEWNACSVEVLHAYVSNHNPGDSSECSSRRTAVPLVIGCYQLLESTSTSSTKHDKDDTQEETSLIGKDKRQRRKGQLRLYRTPQNNNSNESDLSLKSKEPEFVVDVDEGGILDGEWYTPSHGTRRDVQEKSQMQKHWYACACASGKIHLYALRDEVNCLTQENEQLNRKQKLKETPRLSLVRIGSSSVAPKTTDGAVPMCLSLNWGYRNHDDHPKETKSMQGSLVSSYTNGTVALHKVITTHETSLTANSRDDSIPEQVHVHETCRFRAHSLRSFNPVTMKPTTVATEVWTCCFAGSCNSASPSVPSKSVLDVLSGGDDGTLKGWDLRTISTVAPRNQPAFESGEAEFQAGVTSVSWHPNSDYIFAAGSYDGVVRLFDIRKLGSNRDLAKEAIMGRVDVGGGVWRLKWRPCTNEKKPLEEKEDELLVGAMHGGAHVIRLSTSSSASHTSDSNKCAGDDVSVEVVSRFCDHHKSMVYGADWVPNKDRSNVQHEWWAATCSFYDKQAYVWCPRPL